MSERERARDQQRRARLVGVLAALDRRDELFGILHRSATREQALDRVEQQLGIPADAADMLLGLRLELLLPDYEAALRREIDAIDARQP